MTALQGADDFKRKLIDMAERSDDLNAVWDGAVAEMWKDRQLAVFAGGLPALSKASVRRKRVHKNDPMIDTGELRYVTYRYSPIKASRDSATYGIPKGSGALNGRGRKAIGAMHAKASGSRPKRDVVPKLTAAERAQILEIIDGYVKGARNRPLQGSGRWGTTA